MLNAGIDTLYLNVYHADPNTYSRLDHPLGDELQATFNTLQQQAKSTRQNREPTWTLDNKPLYMLSHGTGQMWHWILHNDDINVQLGIGDYRGLIAHARVSSQYLWKVRALPHILGLVNGCMNKVFAHEMYLAPSEIDLCVEKQQALRQQMGTRWRNKGLVICNHFGNVIDTANLTMWFKELLKAAGLPNVRFHDLRHSAATLLFAMGVHPKIVQELLGHSSVAITMDVYSHALPSMHQEAMRKMDSIFREK